MRRKATQLATTDAHARKVMAAGGPDLYFAKQEGTTFKSATLTTDERAIVERAIARKRFRMRECFHNAQRIMLDDVSRALVYVEGYRRSAPFALHAWVAINGKVIDVTASPKSHHTPLTIAEVQAMIPDRVLGRFARGEGYRGVAFASEVLHASAFRFGRPLLDNWEAGYPAEHGHLDRFRVK